MKSILNNWRKFIVEGEVIYSGILKIPLDPYNISVVEPLQSMLPQEAKRLDKDDLHVTLVHQSILGKFKDKLADIPLPDPPKVVLEDGVWEREDLGKKSWAIRLANQDEMREYVETVMKLLGSNNTNPEPERVFHVSLANLTGNPHDSVR
jgi:hypothetical protein